MPVIAIGIWLCAYLGCAGWLLSAIHSLTPTGYAVALPVGLAVLFALRGKIREGFPLRNGCGNFRRFRRFRRPLPALFLFLTFLIFTGGLLNAPNNYDALTYRLPRMLNWLSAGHWFWIPTINDRLNYSTTAWEWIAMPLLALTRSDRGLFLINALGFLLMPGLLFSVCRQAGVARKVAWTWMWILPLAYGYATQAASVGNDFTGAVFCLASVHFGLRARHSGRVSDVWLAGLAAALMTGSKLSNLPLLLPCLVAVWPALGKLRKNLAGSAAVAGLAVVVSAAPTIVLNQLHTGCWNGDPKNQAGLASKSPGTALLGNSLLLVQQSLMPPLLPAAQKVSGWLDRQLPASWHEVLREKFPRYYLTHLNELPQEEASALGLGITALLLTAIGATVWGLGRSGAIRGLTPALSPVGLAAWVSALFLMLKMGSEADPRLMLPYYPLAIVPMLLLPAQDRLLRFRGWRILLLLAGASVLPAVILSPARPLWPAKEISERLAREHSDSAALQRLATVYAAYANRNDALAPLRSRLPDTARTVGFVADTDDSDYSLWRPFGARTVVYLRDDSHSSVTLPNGVEWIVVKERIWPQASDVPLEAWAAQHQANLVLSVPVLTLVGRGEETWCLLHIVTP